MRKSLPGAAGLLIGLLALVSLAPVGLGQAASQAPPSSQPAAPAPWTVLTKDGRQPLATTLVNGREFVSAAELGRLFGVEVREDPMTRGLALSVQGRTIVLSPATGLASIGGRVITLSAPPQRGQDGWLVPLDFIDRALSVVHEPKIDVRPGAHLIVVGDLRVPRVTVAVEAQPTGSRVTLDISPPTSHTVVQEPGRLLVRFQAEALELGALPQAPGGLVQAVRQQPNVPALAIELGPGFATFRANSLPAEGNTQRLTIDLVAAAEPDGAPGTPGAPPTTEATPPPPLLQETGPAINTIVIDPGHGGEKDGARGPAGSYEKHVTLAIARQLKAALEARLGVRVLMTREDDRHVELDERAAFANNNKADLFISLHTNASVSRAPAGAEVFFLSLDGYSPEARRVAMEEGAVLPSVTGGDRQIEIILWEMAQVQHLEQSAVLAGYLEQALRHRVKMSARAIQQAPFRVLVGANMPAVLVELGFITNPAEEKLLNSPAHQKQLVASLVDGIVAYKNSVEAQRPSVTASPEAQAAGVPAPSRIP
ncbi:MAG TPA: N-acetylmuramoyl-L-alanine amidase [Vicinamibacterales bacterium]